jgi:hypothetical protein
MGHAQASSSSRSSKNKASGGSVRKLETHPAVRQSASNGGSR